MIISQSQKGRGNTHVEKEVGSRNVIVAKETPHSGQKRLPIVLSDLTKNADGVGQETTIRRQKKAKRKQGKAEIHKNGEKKNWRVGRKQVKKVPITNGGSA